MARRTAAALQTSACNNHAQPISHALALLWLATMNTAASAAAHLADVIHKDCIPNAHHERHTLQAIPSLGCVLQPLHHALQAKTSASIADLQLQALAK
jgi:hypothetical protein